MLSGRGVENRSGPVRLENFGEGASLAHQLSAPLHARPCLNPIRRLAELETPSAKGTVSLTAPVRAMLGARIAKAVPTLISRR